MQVSRANHSLHNYPNSYHARTLHNQSHKQGLEYNVEAVAVGTKTNQHSRIYR
jgi:hypothetical protein